MKGQQAALRIDAPAPLVGEGCAAGRPRLDWVRGLPAHFLAPETTPHPASLREATLSHKERG